MNLIKKGIIVAVILFISTLTIGHFVFGKINWILSFGIAGGSLLGNLFRYLWERDAKREREVG